MSRHEGGGGSHESDESEKKNTISKISSSYCTSQILKDGRRLTLKKKIPESPDVVRRMKNILSCLKEREKYQIFNIYLISYDNLTA